MKVAHVDDLDSFSTWLWYRKVVGLRTKICRSVRRESKRLGTEVGAHKITQILAIRTRHISQGKDLSVNSTKIFGVIGFMAACVGPEFGAYAQLNQQVRDECRSSLGHVLTDLQCRDTFGAVSCVCS